MMQDSLAKFANQTQLPASEDVKWQGSGSFPDAATTVAQTITFRGFLSSEYQLILGH